jgi:hypothetical protein
VQTSHSLALSLCASVVMAACRPDGQPTTASASTPVSSTRTVEIPSPDAAPSPRIFTPSEKPPTIEPNLGAGGCRQLWSDGLRRPSRFTLVAPCITLTGTVRRRIPEEDGDVHVLVEVDVPYEEAVLNTANREFQHGMLVVEIEPWQRGETSTASGAAAVNGRSPSPFCPQACDLQPGQRVRITSAIVTDNEDEHGWNEAHSPANVEILP